MKKLMRFNRIIMMLFASISIVSCVAPSGGGYQQKPIFNSLGGQWQLSGSSITIQFDNNKASGFSGCNRYFASTTQQGNGKLTFGFIGSTKKMCMNSQANKQESSYLRALRQISSYQLNGNRLVLQGNSTQLVFFKQ